MRMIGAQIDRAWQLLQAGRPREAAAEAAAILAREPQNVPALACHAMAGWRSGGDVHFAIAEVKQALTLAPAMASLWHNLATLEASLGESAAAAASFRRALDLRPDDMRAFYGLSQNSRFAEETELLRRMNQLYRDGVGLPADREFLCFGLAKAFDDVGQYSRAMAFCLEANALAARPYDATQERRALAELEALAVGNALKDLVDSGQSTRAPLFIVGMPRSGTTLIEAIVARHPEVYAAGESMLIPEAEGRLIKRLRAGGYRGERNSALLEIPAEALRQAAAWVLKHMQEAQQGRFAVFTDKLPDNALRLGWIARMFPRARVIYARRHPLDTCVSNLFMRFAAGQGFAFDQSLLGERFRQVADSMALWKRLVPLPILDVSYERLVADPETESRRIIAFAGLDWTDACLRPQEGKRGVMTASQWQVRQPIYTTSSGRWRNYRQWLDPLVAAMGGQDWIDREAEAGWVAGGTGSG